MIYNIYIYTYIYLSIILHLLGICLIQVAMTSALLRAASHLPPLLPEQCSDQPGPQQVSCTRLKRTAEQPAFMSETKRGKISWFLSRIRFSKCLTASPLFQWIPMDSKISSIRGQSPIFICPFHDFPRLCSAAEAPTPHPGPPAAALRGERPVCPGAALARHGARRSRSAAPLPEPPAPKDGILPEIWMI